MKTHFDKMTKKQAEKAQFILKTALNLGMKIDGYGDLAVNDHSGNVYLWLEDYPFCLFMPTDCDLIFTEFDVFVNWTDYNSGDEFVKCLSNFSTLEDIYQWCDKLEAENNFKEQ
jgi:hypothetical protein